MKRIISSIALLVGISVMLTFPAEVFGTPYGAGSYGTCQYESCSITLSSSSSVAADVTPVGSSTTCTVRSDNVAVTTDSSTGYMLLLNDSDTTNQMSGSVSETIAPVSGTAASPSPLSANKWGYRVDGSAGFGSGPTSAITNAAVPSLLYAPVPLSSDSPDTIVSSSAPAPTPASTSVWYGVCADSSLPSGIYTDDVIYTAVIN